MNSGLLQIEVDEKLLARLRAGDAEAQTVLYQRFAPPAFNLAARLLGDRDLAEDLTQDVFVELLGSLASFRNEAPFAAWLRRIVVNRCLSRLRSPWQRRRRPLEAEQVQESEAMELLGPGESRRLEWALNQLPANSRAVLWLHDVEGYTHREIGAAMGRSVSYSKSQLARAHQRLRQLMSSTTRQEGETCIPAQNPC